ncbi:MAG TPA: hypothetical protein DCY53_04740 [Desulfobacteraceae bacterium]|nr:hypothetical protein [Desulfobacteraceae bacterium]
MKYFEHLMTKKKQLIENIKEIKLFVQQISWNEICFYTLQSATTFLGNGFTFFDDNILYDDPILNI